MLLLALTLGACAGKTGTQEIRADFAGGNLEALQHKFAADNEEDPDLLSALNLARICQMRGEWQESIAAYEQARLLVEDYEQRAIVNVRGVAASVASATLARGSGGYHGTGYERTLLHTFNALNYIMLEDYTGAAVEMRRMRQRQEMWLEEKNEKMRKRIENKEETTNIPAGYSLREILEDPEYKSMLTGYQDSFSYALSSIIFRIAGDKDSADTSLKRACVLNAQAEKMFSAGFGKMAATQKGKWNQTTPPMPRPGAKNIEITLVHLGGLAPAKKMEQLRIAYAPGGYLLIDIPSLTAPVQSIAPPDIFTFKPDYYQLLNTTILALSDLNDDIGYETATSISRAVTRAAVATGSKIAASANDDTRAAADLIGLLVTLGMDAYASIDAENVRNWETLPAQGGLALTTIPRTEKLTLNLSSGPQELEIKPETRGLFFISYQISTNQNQIYCAQY